QEIGFTSHYQGIIERNNVNLEVENDAMIITLNNKVINGADAYLEDLRRIHHDDFEINVYNHSHKDLSIVFDKQSRPKKVTKPVVYSIIKDHLRILDRLKTAHEGFVLVDHARLLKSLRLSLGYEKCEGKAYEFSEFTHLIYLLNSGASTEVKPGKGGFVIQLKYKRETYILFTNICEENTLDEVMNELALLKENKSNKLRFYVADQLEKIRVSPEILHTASAFFPAWVPLFKEQAFQQYLVNQMARFSPAYLKMQVVLLDAKEMTRLLGCYRKWARKMKVTYDRSNCRLSDGIKAKISFSAYQILKEFVIE
ncbi:MAG: hypothetical protein WBA74_00095, partial [Cyclobacteriaceae bacterium]